MIHEGITKGHEERRDASKFEQFFADVGNCRGRGPCARPSGIQMREVIL